jgi:hypothetical protein
MVPRIRHVEAKPMAMAAGLHHLPTNPHMPTAMPVGVASSSKFRAVDTWLYADGIAVDVAQTAVSLSAVTPAVSMAKAHRWPHEAIALPMYADGYSYADGHPGGPDGIYADGATPTVAVGVGLHRRFS